jgi:hypothetical protein
MTDSNTGRDLQKLDSLTARKWENLVSYVDGRDYHAKANALNELLRGSHYSTTIRVYAALLARQWGDQETVRVLWQLIRIGINSELAEPALMALAALAKASSISELHSWLESDRAANRMIAVKAANALPDEEAVKFLATAAIRHDDPDVRYLAAIYLSYRGREDGLTVLQDAARNPIPSEFNAKDRRRGAVCALALLGDQDARTELLTLLKDGSVPKSESRSILLLLGRYHRFADLPEDDLRNQLINWFEACRS